MKGIDKVHFPESCKGPAENLIRSLLKKEPSERLPMRPGGASNIKNHPWYKGFDWQAMEELRLEPPYKPIVKSKTDIANFSANREDMPEMIHYESDGTDWDKDFATVSNKVAFSSGPRGSRQANQAPMSPVSPVPPHH